MCPTRIRVKEGMKAGHFNVHQDGDKIVGTNVTAKNIVDKLINAHNEEVIRNEEIKWLLSVIAFGKDETDLTPKNQETILAAANKLENSGKFNCLRFMYRPQEIIMMLELKDECLISHKAIGTEAIEKLKQIAKLDAFCKDLLKDLKFEVHVQPIYFKSVYLSIMKQIDI